MSPVKYTGAARVPGSAVSVSVGVGVAVWVSLGSGDAVSGSVSVAVGVGSDDAGSVSSPQAVSPVSRVAPTASAARLVLRFMASILPARCRQVTVIERVSTSAPRPSPPPVGSSVWQRKV